MGSSLTKAASNSRKRKKKAQQDKAFRTSSADFPQVVKGSNFEMGYQQGQLNAWHIQNWLFMIFSDKRLGFFKLLEWPMRLASPFMGPALNYLWKPYLQRYLPEVLERMEGIAQGAGLSLGNILYQQSVEILGAFPLHRSGCASIAAGSQFFETNEPILAKNFDYLPFLTKLQIVRASYPEKGYASLDLTVTSLAGCHAGINECGLVVIYHYAYSRDENQSGLPLSIFAQHLLQTCSTVDEAFEKIGRVPWLASGMFLLGDKKNRFAKAELSHSHLTKRKIAEKWAVITNHLYEPEMKEYAMSPESKFPNILPSPWKGTRIRESSEMRLHDLEDFLQRREKLTLHDVQEILKDHSGAQEGSNNTICRHSYISSTISSTIFFPSSLRVLYCHAPPCSGTYQTYRLKD